jgi:hypothetical protein
MVAQTRLEISAIASERSITKQMIRSSYSYYSDEKKVQRGTGSQTIGPHRVLEIAFVISHNNCRGGVVRLLTEISYIIQILQKKWEYNGTVSKAVPLHAM